MKIEKIRKDSFVVIGKKDQPWMEKASFRDFGRMPIPILMRLLIWLKKTNPVALSASGGP